MTFLEQRLELGLNFGATYGPRFNTAIATSANGIEQRRAIWSQPLITVQLGDRRVNQSELDYLLDFHASVKGAFAGFRLRDWSDYKSGLTAIGTGNGTAQTWQLVKRYTVDSVTVTRTITKPINGTLKVFVGGVQTLTGWTCNYTTGVLSTELTGAIVVTFDFDIPVRFEQDKIDFTYEGGKGTRKLFTLAPLTCVELRLEPAIYPTLDVLPTEINEVFDLGYDFGTLGGPSFNTAIATNAAEFESRKSYWENAKGSWDVGDRGLLRSELDYFIALFRCARGMAVPFYFKDWQDEAIKLVRFAEDRISFRFDAFRSSDEEVIFNLGGVAIAETLPIPKIDSKTYVIPLVDISGSMDSAIPNITEAIAELKTLLQNQVYGTIEATNKYVKNPIEFGDQRYLRQIAQDYRDNVTEPVKYLFLVFENENSRTLTDPDYFFPDYFYEFGYHKVPRVTGEEPYVAYENDLSEFVTAYNSSALFNCLIFVPTSSPPISYEVAFNQHLTDAIGGNNGYTALSDYNIFAQTNWPINANGEDIYGAIIEFLT